MKFGQRLYPARSRAAVRGAKIPTGLPSTPDTIDCAVGVTDAGSKKVRSCITAGFPRSYYSTLPPHLTAAKAPGLDPGRLRQGSTPQDYRGLQDLCVLRRPCSAAACCGCPGSSPMRAKIGESFSGNRAVVAVRANGVEGWRGIA